MCSQEKTAQDPRVLLACTCQAHSVHGYRDAGFGFRPSYTPCQPSALHSFPCSPLHPGNPTSMCMGAVAQGYAGQHEGQESATHRGCEERVLCFASWLQHSRACTVAHNLTPPGDIASAPRVYHGWGHGPLSQLDATDTFVLSLPGSSHRTQMLVTRTFCPCVHLTTHKTKTCTEDIQVPCTLSCGLLSGACFCADNK